MAENTEEQNINMVADAITSTYNPFEQSEELVNNEFVTNDTFENQTEPTTEVTEPVAPAVEAPISEDVETNDDPVSWLNEQWRSQGVKIESLDDVPAIFAEYKRLIAEKPQEYTLEERSRIKLARDTGNWNLYDQIVSVDTKTIEPTDAMRIKFVLEHPEMARPFAEKLFEKNLKSSISEEDSEEFIAQYLDHEGNIAKRWLDDKKASINIAEDSKVDEVKQSDDQWFANVDKVINQIAQEKFEVTYEVEDKSVNVVIDQDEFRELRDAMDSPQTWLRDNILNEQGGFDHLKLAQLIIKDLHSAKTNKEFYELGRVHQEQHLLNKQRGVTTATTATGAPRNNSDPRDDIANVFNKYRNG